MTRWMLALFALVPACSKKSGGVPGDVAGLLVTVHQDSAVGAEQYRVTVFDGTEAIDLDQDLFPAQAGGTLGPVESVQLLFGGVPDGWVARVDVTAMRGGDGVASGEADSDPLALGRNVTVDIYLEGGTGGDGGAESEGEGDGGGGCDHDSCDGCCAGDECKPGDADAQCGVDGNACLDCADEGGVCVGGACAWPACRAETCEGCCDGVACVARKDQSDMACGSGGVPCVSCEDVGGTCEAGKCEGCEPDCVGRYCGPDSCGSTCGDCDGVHEYCSADGLCECLGPICADECCPEDAVCSSFTGGCCLPSCDGLECGGDGCGGSCGPCTGTQTCVSGACTCPLAGVECGDECCNPLTEVCVSDLGDVLSCCTPACDPSASCGDSDGCGGSCDGLCEDIDETCDADTGSCDCLSGMLCGEDCCASSEDCACTGPGGTCLCLVSG